MSYDTNLYVCGVCKVAELQAELVITVGLGLVFMVRVVWFNDDKIAMVGSILVYNHKKRARKT